MTPKIYPDSGVELTPFISRHYDRLINAASLGFYRRFIRKAVSLMHIRPGDAILDMGCGTGRNARLMAAYLKADGRIVGLDLSREMEKQFRRKFPQPGPVRFIRRRVDEDFDLEQSFDKVWISFVLHGFPQEVRGRVIRNALRHLNPGGRFFILDFAEFDIGTMPPVHRWLFRTLECPYAFDFIKRDWKSTLADAGFGAFTEHFFLRRYIRLLEAVKPESRGA